MTDLLIQSIIDAYQTSLGGPFPLLIFLLALFGMIAYRYNLNSTSIIFGFILIAGTFTWMMPAMPVWMFYATVLAGGVGVRLMFRRLVIG